MYLLHNIQKMYKNKFEKYNVVLQVLVIINIKHNDKFN